MKLSTILYSAPPSMLQNCARFQKWPYMAYTQLTFFMPCFGIHMNIHTFMCFYACVEWHLSISLRRAACLTRSVSFLWQLVFAFVVLFLFSNSFHFWFMHSNSVCLSISCIFTHSLPVTGTHTHTLTYWVCLLLFMKCSYSSAWAATVFWCQRHTEVYRGGLQRMCKHRCKANLFFVFLWSPLYNLVNGFISAFVLNSLKGCNF